MSNTINKSLKYIIITGLALVPFIQLYIANPLFFPFISGKAFVFRIIVEIVFALWLVLVLREKGTGLSEGVAPRVNMMTILVTAFAFIVLIADLFGMNPLRSIWSNYERMEGWMTIVHLWAYFIVLSSVFGGAISSVSDSSGSGIMENLEARKNWHRFLNVVLFGAFITAVYGLFQFFGWADIHQGSVRVDASLGNSAYMAIYMLINAFIAGYMACTSYCKKKMLISKFRKDEANNSKISFLRKLKINLPICIYSVLAIFFSFIMFQTATRGTILGWIAGILIACAIYAIFGRSSLKNENEKINNKGNGQVNGQEIEKGQSVKSRLIVGGVFTFLILLGVLFYFNRDSKFIQRNEVLARLATISLSDTKTQARGYVWPMAVNGSFSSGKTALIGWGQENFNYLFNTNYNPEMYKHEQWFDRAHSVFLDWLVAGGLLGLGLYLSLYIISLIYIWKSDLTIGRKSMLIALLVGYGIHNIFVFDNQTSYIMFFTFLAFIHSFKSGKVYSWFYSNKWFAGVKSDVSEIGRNNIANKNNSNMEDFITIRDYIFLPIVVIAFISGFYFINIRNIQANTRLISAMMSCSGGGNTPSTALFERALKLNQTNANQEIREQLISCATNVIGSNLSEKIKSDFYVLTKKEIENQIAEAPLDARMYVIGGSFLNSIGDFKSALPILEKALELTPGKQSVKFDLATNYMNIGRAEDALKITKDAYESAIDNQNSKIAYITTLINAGKEKEAHQLFPNDTDIFTDQRIINIYIQKKQFDKVIEIYKELIKKNPKDAQTNVYLALAYLMNKQNWLALSELRSIAIKFPETKAQVDAIIKQIEEGKNPLQ